MPPMFNTYNNAQQTPLVHHPQEPGLGNPPSRGHIQSLNSSTRHPDVAAILPTGYGLPKPSVDPRSLSNKGTSSPSNASTPPQRGVLSVGYEESATILPPGYRHTVQTSKITNPLARPTLDPSSNVAQAHSSGHSRPSQNSTFQENSRAPQLITTQTVHRPSQYQNGSLSQPKPFSIILSLSPSRPSLAIPPQSRVTSVIKDSPITSGTSSRASSTARRRPGKRPKDLSIATEIPSSSKDNLRAGHLGYAGKKRGRHLKTGEAGVKAAAIKASTYSKMAGQLSRPRKRWEHTEVPVPEPIYYAFICEWKGCVAELQNLETLRRHLLVIHGMKQENGRIACLWRNCRKAGEVTQEVAASDSDEVVQVPVSEPLEFLTRHSWKDHIQIHIQHIAQYMGDGPKGTYLGTHFPLAFSITLKIIY